MENIELPKTAKLIEGSDDHWIDIDGSVYCFEKRFAHRRRLIKKVQNKVHGCLYCTINFKGRRISKRIHRLVAKAFIPNPENYTVVGHKNNIKSDNRVENLYWTTIKDNTQKAVDDGLMANDRGFDDSQSKPVKMFDTKTNGLIGVFGSICDASKETGILKGTIINQAKYKRPVRKPYYFRFLDDDDCLLNQELVGSFDIITDELVDTYVNSGDASRSTGVNEKCIRYDLKNGKPKHNFSRNVYFRYIVNNKCEETIENLRDE